MIRRYRPTILIIMETHTTFISTKVFWDRVGYSPIHIVEAQGHSGGIWFLIQHGVSFSTSVVDVEDQYVTVALSKGNRKWYFTGLYASPNPIQ